MVQVNRRLGVVGYAPAVDHGLFLGPFWGKGIRISANSPIESWPPQKYLNVTDSAWKSRARSSYDSTRYESRER